MYTKDNNNKGAIMVSKFDSDNNIKDAALDIISEVHSNELTIEDFYAFAQMLYPKADRSFYVAAQEYAIDAETEYQLAQSGK